MRFRTVQNSLLNCCSPHPTGPTGKILLMPEDPNAVFIMVATGTGIAPYRAFWRRQFMEDVPNYKCVLVCMWTQLQQVWCVLIMCHDVGWRIGPLLWARPRGKVTQPSDPATRQHAPRARAALHTPSRASDCGGNDS